MKELFRPTLVRRVVLALLIGFPLAWVVLIARYSLALWQAQQLAAHNFAAFPLGQRFQRALRDVSEPAEVRTIFAAQDRINGNDGSIAYPAPLFQVWDRRDQHLVYSTRAVADLHLRGNPAQKTPQLLHGREYVVFEVDTPRWSVLWGRAPATILWILLALDEDLLPGLALAIPCVLLPTWFAVSRGLLPLRRLSERIASRGPEDISPVGIDPKHAELKPLVRALDGLLTKLRHKIEAERLFVANAAHELRTPLAVITAQAHVLAKTTLEPDREEAERRLDAAIARSSHLIHQLLALARLEMERPVESDVMDVAQFIREELTHFVPAALARNIEISLEAPDSLLLQWEAHTLQSILQNLLDNAIRYGRDGGSIVVELQPSPGSVQLSVADDGPGIAESDRVRIFDRFFRGARREEVSGTGLGLTIVKQAAIRMGADLQIAQGLDGQGCCFTLVIPVARTCVVKVF
jgi:two-component system, OmpR family, sensor histidine kinase QseC